MAVREYIGARYVPLFSDPVEWDETLAYEPLTVVINQGNSYVSKQFVPAGTPLPTTAERSNAYWLLWADFNAQIEQYRAEVATYSGRINANAEAIQGLDEDLAAEILARTNADTSIRDDFAADLAAEATRINEALAAAVDELEQTDAAISNKLNSWNPATTISIPESRITKVATLDLPAGHTIQPMEIVDGYVFIGHHLNADDSQPFYISKYDMNNDYGLVSRNAISQGGIHGNSMSYDVVTQNIVLCDAKTKRLYYIDPVTLNVTKTSGQAGNITPASIAFCRDGVNALAGATGSRYMLAYQQVHNNLYDALVCLGLNGTSETRSKYFKQDMTAVGSREPYMQLLSNIGNFNLRNAIVVYSRWGDEICTYTLPHVFDNIELEGIAAVLDSNNRVNHVYIVDKVGNLYDIYEPNPETPAGLFAGWGGMYYNINNTMMRPSWQFPRNVITGQDYTTSLGNTIQRWYPFVQPDAAPFAMTPVEFQVGQYRSHMGASFASNLMGTIAIPGTQSLNIIRLIYNIDAASSCLYLGFVRVSRIKQDGTFETQGYTFNAPSSADYANNDAIYDSLFQYLATANIGFNASEYFGLTKLQGGVNLEGNTQAIQL